MLSKSIENLVPRSSTAFDTRSLLYIFDTKFELTSNFLPEPLQAI